jgi:hypothetical protein
LVRGLPFLVVAALGGLVLFAEHVSENTTDRRVYGRNPS